MGERINMLTFLSLYMYIFPNVFGGVSRVTLESAKETLPPGQMYEA